MCQNIQHAFMGKVISVVTSGGPQQNLHTNGSSDRFAVWTNLVGITNVGIYYISLALYLFPRVSWSAKTSEEQRSTNNIDQEPGSRATVTVCCKYCTLHKNSSKLKSRTRPSVGYHECSKAIALSARSPWNIMSLSNVSWSLDLQHLFEAFMDAIND